MSAADEAGSQQTQLVEEVLSGQRPELQRLAARGLLPLPPTRLVWLQVVLAEGSGGEVSDQAAESLRAMDPTELAGIVGEDLDVGALTWLCQNVQHSLVLEAILRRQDVPRSLLEHLASSLSPDLQEILLLRQDAIVEAPAILEALERNPELTSYSRRRLTEYRRHLLREPEREPAPTAEVTEEEEVEEATEEEVAEAIRIAKDEPEGGDVDEVTGLSEVQLRTLPLPVRLKLSRRAPRALRTILVRDSNATVAVSVLENNPMSDSEVEQIARSRAVVDDVLRAIARNRSWIRKYPITVALVKNPRTPAGIAVRLASRLSVRDLRGVAKDRNVSHAVRSACQRLYKLKLS